MKFILSFLFGFILLASAFASVTENCSSISDPTVCTNTGGCEFAEGECSQCQSGWVSLPGADECTQCETGFDNGWSAQHKQHPDGASSCSDWECTDDYFPIDTNGDGTPDECSACDPTTLPDNAEFTDSCTWRCIIGYYKTNNTCTECPTGSTTTAAGATDISQCTCTGNFYMSGNNTCTACPSNTAECAGLSVDNVTCQTGFIKNITNGVVTCSSCPEHTEQSGNTCVCSVGYYGEPNGLNTSCTACPANATTASAGSTDISACACDANYYMAYDNTCRNCPAHATCTAGATTDSISCETGYIKNVTTNGTVTCDDCPANSTASNNICKCNAGYYSSDGNAPCKKCPYGTTTTGLGKTANDCAANSNTMFCDANGNNCMRLIPPTQ